MLICGSCGVGKGVLACALTHTACQLGYRARYISISCPLDDFALTPLGESTIADAILDRLVRPPTGGFGTSTEQDGTAEP